MNSYLSLLLSLLFLIYIYGKSANFKDNTFVLIGMNTGINDRSSSFFEKIGYDDLNLLLVNVYIGISLKKQIRINIASNKQSERLIPFKTNYTQYSLSNLLVNQINYYRSV